MLHFLRHTLSHSRSAWWLTGLLCLPLAAGAQYTGPSTVDTVGRVEQILKDPRDDQQVRLQGRLVRQVGAEKYLFADASGEIRVEIEHEVFPAVPVGDATLIEIGGEVEKDFFESPEIDVDWVRVLPAR